MRKPKFTLEGRRIWVAGHRGTAGSAICRRLQKEDCELLTVGRDQVDLSRQTEVEEWMTENRPEAVVLAAAKVGGIHANDGYPAEFIYNNLAIQNAVIHSAFLTGVKKLVFLGSSCIYPRLAPQPMKEEALLSGALEPTNQWYAVAKIAGLKLCQAYRRQYGCDFISTMPANLYGPGDNFDPASSHAAAALMVRIHRARLEGQSTVEIWGTGTPRRELLYVDDMADGLIFLLKNYSAELQVNIGNGRDYSIKEIAEKIAGVVGWKGEFTYARDKPDGMPRKVLDVSRLTRMGWCAGTPLEEGVQKTYQWYLAQVANRTPSEPESRS